MTARRELFPPDRGLQLRMALALAINGTMFIAAMIALVWLTLVVENGWSFTFFILCFAFIGAVAARKASSGRKLTAADRARAEASVERIAVVADMPAPAAEVRADVVPLSWTHSKLGRRPQVYVTTALLDAVSDPELDALVAHEVTHIQHRDAVVMTLLSATSTWILRGNRRMWERRHEDWRNVLSVICFGWYCVPFAAVFALMTYVVSRHRELAADRGAAVLTGSPARVATVLERLAGDIHAIPTRDLRLAGASDAFHVLPARKGEHQGISRVWATHPRLKTRLRQLARLESDLQRGRP